MMRLDCLIVIAAAFVLTGCATGRKTPAPSSGRIVTERPQHDAGRKILYPRGSEVLAEDERREAETSSSVTLTPRYEMTFSGLECEHVRVQGVNPLPQGGVLILSLDDLKHEFCYPYRGKFISDYGMRGNSYHTGIDIKAIPNDTIRAAFAGVVRMAKNYSSYGNIVVIRHYAGFETVYSHNSKNLVKVNDRVEAGTPIGLAGRTGRATTEHLHWEVRAAGHHIDPKRIVDPMNMTLREGKLYLKIENGELIAYVDQSELDYKMASRQREAIDRRQEDEQDAAREQTTETTSRNTGASYYRVQKGDTLSAIARRHSTTVSNLCRLNGISEKSILQINQRLRVK